MQKHTCSAQNNWMNAHHFVDGVKSPKILSYTIGRGKTVVSIIRTYKYRLAKGYKICLGNNTPK